MIESFLLEFLQFEAVVRPWNVFPYSRGFVTLGRELIGESQLSRSFEMRCFTNWCNQGVRRRFSLRSNHDEVRVVIERLRACSCKHDGLE